VYKNKLCEKARRLKHEAASHRRLQQLSSRDNNVHNTILSSRDRGGDDDDDDDNNNSSSNVPYHSANLVESITLDGKNVVQQPLDSMQNDVESSHRIEQHLFNESQDEIIIVAQQQQQQQQHAVATDEVESIHVVVAHGDQVLTEKDTTAHHAEKHGRALDSQDHATTIPLGDDDDDADAATIIMENTSMANTRELWEEEHVVDVSE